MTEAQQRRWVTHNALVHYVERLRELVHLNGRADVFGNELELAEVMLAESVATIRLCPTCKTNLADLHRGECDACQRQASLR